MTMIVGNDLHLGLGFIPTISCWPGHRRLTSFCHSWLVVGWVLLGIVDYACKGESMRASKTWELSGFAGPGPTNRKAGAGAK